MVYPPVISLIFPAEAQDGRYAFTISSKRKQWPIVKEQRGRLFPSFLQRFNQKQ